MQFLITGGAGFIGSTLAERLLQENHSVVVIDNLSTGKKTNLKEHPALTFIEGDIASTETVQKVFANHTPEIVIHAAASYKDPEAWKEDVETNVIGTINILNSSKSAKTKKLIYFQTALCYGLNPMQCPIELGHPIQAGGSSYSISKTTGEYYIELSGLNFISLRLANMFGPRNLSGPVPTFFQRLSQNKPCYVVNTRRDFVFVGDLIDLLMKAIFDSDSSGYYHVSSGKDYSIKELYDCIVEAMRLTGLDEPEIRERNENDAYSILLDPSKTNKDFQWQAKTSLKAGIEKAVKWYQQNPIENTYTHLNLETDRKVA